MSSSPRAHSFRPSADRRETRRHTQDELPWIKELTVTGRHGQLIDLSSTGVFFEASLRLLPGLRTVVLLTTTNGGRERLEGEVIRSQLVRCDADGQPVYRSAVKFSHLLDLRDTDDASAGAHIAVDSSSRRVQILEMAA